MADLKRIALISGGSGGIGRATAKKLARDGVKIYVGFRRNQSSAEKTVSEIRVAGGEADLLFLDVTRGKQLDEGCRQIYEQEGSLDILVNCVGDNKESPALGMEDDVWRQVLETNLDGIFKLCRAAAKFMVLGRWGRIVNLSSISAVRGGRGQVNYAASKAGLEAMARVLALELGRKGVLVNCVAPGVIETEMSARIRRDHGEKIIADIPLGRFGKPEEVAELIAFLVSDAADYITGQVIKMDGGLTL